MFFAPPKVKSLSRYAEFGTYLRQRDFMLMLAIAACIHACIIAAYSLVPREEVVRIPVRVLNIKLGGSKLGDGEIRVGAEEPPKPAPPQAGAADAREITVGKPLAAQEPPALHSQAAQNLLDKAFKTNPAKSVYDSHMKRQHTAQNFSSKAAAAQGTLDTPKKYVREADMNAAASSGTGHGKGTGSGKGAGEEIVERYEQAVSLWISQHKTYPQAAVQQSIEGDAIVRIRIDRSGHILYNSIDRSSGNPLIDQAVIAMVQASDPVPRVPEDYPEGSQLEFLIPVSFRMQ